MNAILATKVSIPVLHADLARPRLLRLLDSLIHCRLIAVSAFAGYGKTTLIAQWLFGRRAAWLNLDREDNDPAQLQRYFNAISRDLPLTEEAWLVLDNLDALDNAVSYHELARLLETLPPHWHTILISRMQIPAILLAARDGAVGDLGNNDLRFMATEAAEFLRQYMALHLPDEVLTALYEKLHQQTNGWITGLKLAADSLRRLHGKINDQHLANPLRLCERHLDAYFEQEVLSDQPQTLRRFLIQTAILDALDDPSLCDAVTGRADSHVLLAILHQHHLDEPLLRWRLRRQLEDGDSQDAQHLGTTQLDHLWFYAAADLDHLQQAELYMQRAQFQQAADAFALVGSAGSDLTHLGMAELCWAWDDLAAASHHLGRSLMAEDAQIRFRSYTMLSQVLEARGDVNSAAVALNLAEQMKSADTWLLARRARHWMVSSHVNAALQWLYGCGLNVRDQFTIQDRYAYVAFARVLLLLERYDEAEVISAQLAESFLGDGFLYPAIDVLTILALARNGKGNTAQALDALVRALELAAPSRIVRLFVDGFALNREPVLYRLARMLTLQQRRSDKWNDETTVLLHTVLSALERTYPIRRETSLRSAALLEPLSEREVDVLRLIAHGFSNQEIAARLLIAESTVKRHVYSIFGKLNVRSRTQAMGKADALGLLSEK
ncbi:MAG: LuxR C-terminal-related transcriptional regulator [Anaerolineae bacterium]